MQSTETSAGKGQPEGTHRRAQVQSDSEWQRGCRWR
jgi:hypothetical protein